MENLVFLVIGKNMPILEAVKRGIERDSNWFAYITNELKDFYQLVLTKNVDAVMLSSGLDSESEEEIKNFIQYNLPNIKVIDHYAGGFGLIRSEVLQAFPYLIA